MHCRPVDHLIACSRSTQPLDPVLDRPRLSAPCCRNRTGRARTFSRVTRDTRASFVRIGRTRRDLFFDRHDLRLRFGDGRLEIFQRRRLCGKGLHHLGRKVWKRVDIKGLRHTDL
jgi:hypothetical protein